MLGPFLRWPLAAAFLLATPVLAPAQNLRQQTLSLLSDRCFTCHGPDAAGRRADLRLDVQASAFAVRDSGAAVTPGARATSLLWQRITSDDPSKVMPPPESGLALSAAEIETLGEWIDSGAPWPTHWAFEKPAAGISPPQPPTSPPQQDVATDSERPRSELDRFIVARLAAAGRTGARPAEAAALLRRVHLDLTGLPPSEEQLDAFVHDPSEAAYRRVVEELLASPHYGERMAWPWLEATRYADTDGYQADPTRTAWPWRDQLVRKLNENQPFDQFTIEALAGDLLPGATPEQRLATGLLRNNAHNGEGGRIAEETRVENVFDRTETVGTTWLGLTLECARCHDHKYDPISQRDYYRMFAFFDQSSETGRGRSGGQLAPTMRYVSGEDRERVANLEQRIEELREQLIAPNAELDDAQRAFEAETGAAIQDSVRSMVASDLGVWERSANFAPPGGNADAMFAERYPPELGAGEANGSDPADEPPFRAEPALQDGKVLALPSGQFTVYFRRQIDCTSERRMQLSLGSDDAIKLWCNGELILSKDVRRGARADQERAEVLLQPGRNELLIKIVNTGGAGGIYFRRVGETPGSLPAAVAAAVSKPLEQRDAAERELLRRHYRRTRVTGYAERESRLATLEVERDRALASGLQVSVMDELPPDRRRTTRVLSRGNYQTPGATVTAGTPAFLPPLDAAGATPNRLDLARWLVSGEQPLTARVAVNRAWQIFFGRGLVATPEDFGRQGERPSHPDLLDWLATRFVESGWDVKALHREIVLSATYRQSASAPAESFTDDPQNVLLGRSPRLRLPAWMLRDQALALGGQLVERLGGAPVKPYQPAGIWDEATFGVIKYRRDSGEALYRRSLYVFWRRIVGPTFLFDTPSRLTCTVRRSVTNTPLHALTTLNETGFVEAARSFAARAAAAAGPVPEHRVRWLFRAATAREPRPAELRVLTDRLAACSAEFAAQGSRASALLGVGASEAPTWIAKHELAALTVVASVVLNLDEVLCRP